MAGDITIPTRGIFISTNCVQVIQDRRLIGENIRSRRLAAKLSQEAFAAKIGVEQSYLSGLEAGRRNPTAVTLWHVARALKIEPGALFGPPPADPKKPARGRPRSKN